MSDVASLKISVNTNEVKTADNDLNKLSKTAKTTESSSIGVTKSFNAMNVAIGALGVGALASQFIKLADTVTGIQSKLKLVTSSTQELASAQSELFKIAQTTRQGFSETVDTYSNFAVAMGDMGKSQKEILRVTETVNKAIAISGGTAQQAAAATMQLGQAFASGTLRGDELNSILENSKGLAKAIADGMGVPIGKLRTLGSEGKITAEILANALEKSAASVDEKFGKVGVTVSASVTTMENSLLKLVGTADQAMNGSGGIAEVFTYFAKSMDENNESIIEGGKDAFRALQVMGVGMIQFGTSFYQAGVAIPTAIALAIDAVTQLMENGINDMIGMAEEGTNKVKSLYGGKRVNLGRVDIDTNLSKELLSHYNAIVDTQENAIATQGKLFTDIMGNTTELKKISPPSDKGSGKKGGASAETEKQKNARLKAIEEEAKIQKGYLEGYAELQKDAALEEYNVKLGYEEAYRDFAAQEAIAQYEMELTMLNDLADRQAQSAIAFYEMTRSEKDKINEENLALYEANAGLFNDEQMQTFFAKWQESIEGVKGGYSEIEGVVSSFVEDSLNSKDWTAGLTGQSKALANVGNAYKDIQKQTVKYDKAVKKVNESQLTDEEKKIELKKIEEAQIGAEIGAYSNLAGAMAGFFEEGSKGAQAMTAVSATLGIAQGIQAMISAWGSAPFPFNMPAVAATTAAVLPMIGQLTSMGGSGGGGGSSGSSAQMTMDTAKYESEQADSIVDRLDRQIELLESIDQGGTAAKTKVTMAGSSFEADIAKLWAEMISSPGAAVSITQHRASALTGDKLKDVQYVINWLDSSKDLFSGADWAWLDMSRGDILQFQSDLENAVSSFALNMSDVKDTVKDSSEGFKEIYDSLSGTDFYKMRDLKSAYEELGNSIVGNSKDSMLSYISNAVAEMEKLGANYLATTKGILSGGTVDEQVAALKELSLAFGRTFNNSTEEALNFLDSIELVAESMTEVNKNVKSVFDDIQSFIDGLNDNSIKNPSITFGVFSTSFNSMIDAIASGSDDMIDISGKAMDNARSYLDVVTATATSSRDIEFAKAMLVNKFSGVIATPDLTLNNINSTLINNNQALIGELKYSREEIVRLNDAMIASINYQKQISANTQTSRFVGA